MWTSLEGHYSVCHSGDVVLSSIQWVKQLSTNNKIIGVPAQILAAGDMEH